MLELYGLLLDAYMDVNRFYRLFVMLHRLWNVHEMAAKVISFYKKKIVVGSISAHGYDLSVLSEKMQ